LEEVDEFSPQQVRAIIETLQEKKQASRKIELHSSSAKPQAIPSASAEFLYALEPPGGSILKNCLNLKQMLVKPDISKTESGLLSKITLTKFLP